MLVILKQCALILLLSLFYFLPLRPCLAQTTENQPQQGDALVNYINSLCKNIVENQKLTDKLTEENLADLPVGIAREVGGSTFVIAIDSAKWTRNGWFFNAYASITFPGSTRAVAFRARNIAFNATGLAKSSHVQLLLASDQRIHLGENVDLRLPADGHNYIAFNCQGFKAINVKGEFIFSDGFLVPDTRVAPNKKEVTATFEFNAGDLHNIMTTVSITPFKIRGIDEVAFEVKNAVVDYSDIINPAGFSFPQDYQQAYGENINLWHGFYLKDLEIRMNGLSDDTTKVPTIGAHNLIIDDLGVSGLFTADNLASLKNGSADGWPLTIDHLHVQLLLSKVKGGGLGGSIKVPFLGEDPVAFTASIEQTKQYLNYRFSIATPKEKVFKTPFNATITIDKGSIIGIDRIEGKIAVTCLLHGTLTLKEKILSVKEVKFEKLGLTSRKPYITSGKFNMVTEEQAKGNGFPLHLDSITLKIFPGQFSIGFGVALNFMNSSDKGFAASTYIQVLAKLEDENETITDAEGVPSTHVRQKWKFDKIKVNTISLEVETSVFKLKGSLSIYQDDPVYGDGFSGNIALKIDPILSKGVKVNAYFGNKDDYRYWHLDVYVPVGSITILPPLPVFMTGIMGGASYHMVRKQNFSLDFTKLSATAAAPEGDEALVYVPDAKTGIAFMAGITLAVVREELVNGDIKLEIAFNTHGGLRYIQFDGSAFILAALNSRERSSEGSVPKAPIYVNMSMIYDNENELFHASCKTYINLMGILTGIGPNGLVGEAVLHFDKNDWYVYVGRPSQMFGISILSLVSVETYFMAGTKIEDLPLPPVEVQKIFEGIDLRLMRDEVATRGGKGLAAGFHFKIGFDSADKLTPFYVALAVGAGSDMMMRNYGNAHCEGSSGKIGINGWYASGQAYVFMEGRIGLKVKKKSFEILSLGAAALLQATLPNPAWMRGMLGGHYSVLGGLVKGKFNLTLVLGEQCEIVKPGGELDDIKIIADLKPGDEGGEANVFTAPQVSFNTAMETEFSMPDTKNDIHAYRARLSEFSLSKDGAALTARLEWNSNKDVLVLHTAEILPPKSTLKTVVKLYWEKKAGNGLWEVIKGEDEQVIYEVKEASFTTGEAPTFIPEENVAYSYPVKNQYNLYVNESNQGYVKLNMGQEYLFKPVTDGVAWGFVGRFKDKKKGTLTEVPIVYDVANANVTFQWPADLTKETVYTMTFFKRPKDTGAVDKNVRRSEVTTTSSDGNETSIASNTLEGTITQNIEKELYASAFRTSQFGRFQDKFNTLQNGNDLFDVATGMTAVIGKRSTLKETFDFFELQGKDENSKPLIQLTATADNPWMRDKVAPLIYDSYPVAQTMVIKWREPAILGLKPLKGVTLKNDADAPYKLTDANINAGFAPAKSGTVLIGYFVSYYTTWDFSELVTEAAALRTSPTNLPEGAKRILAGRYSDLVKGYNYPVEIAYTLPGQTQPTFKGEITIKY